MEARPRGPDERQPIDRLIATRKKEALKGPRRTPRAVTRSFSIQTERALKNVVKVQQPQGSGPLRARHSTRINPSAPAEIRVAA